MEKVSNYTILREGMIAKLQKKFMRSGIPDT